MASEDRFKKSVVTTLAKRAANRCSSPECGAITSGPTDNPDGSVNVGEAAHIYGAHPGSARYEPSMSSTDRSSISNAIWLCSNCHKLIDDDPNKYPAGLLFEWQREHENKIAAQIGRVATEIRQRYEKRHLEEFGKLSYLAERIILEKGDYWEFLLTAEIFRFEITPIAQRWEALKKGLYVKPTNRINDKDFINWIDDRIFEIKQILHAFEQLTNCELSRAWGEPGTAGSDTGIVATCRLYTEICNSVISWEENVRFTRASDVFSEAHSLFIGIAGIIIEKCTEIPKFISDTISQKPTSGSFHHTLAIDLPDDWFKKVDIAMKHGISSIKGNL